MLIELTKQEIILLQTCLEYRQRDYMQCEEIYKACAREYYDHRMSEMSALIKKLAEVVIC